MGCDIHAHVEQRWNDQSMWFSCAEFRPFRNYDLFGVLAGVRGDQKPIIEPRGLPDGLSVIVRNRYEGSCFDNHTSSWLTTNELDNVLGHYRSKTGAQRPADFMGILSFMRSIEPLGPVRLVFWFDN